MSKRLTIMYRAGITTERASQLISADDASIVCWDDVFAERCALAQRCRELEADRQKTADELVAFIHQEHAAVCGERDTLRAEVEWLRSLFAECVDYLNYDVLTSIGHGSILHRKMLEASQEKAPE